MFGRIVSGALGGMLPEITRLLIRVQNGEFQDWLAKIVKSVDAWEMQASPRFVKSSFLSCWVCLAVRLPMPLKRRMFEKAFVAGIEAPAFILSTYATATKSEGNIVKSTQVQSNAERSSGLSGRLPFSWVITSAKARMPRLRGRRNPTATFCCATRRRFRLPDRYHSVQGRQRNHSADATVG